MARLENPTRLARIRPTELVQRLNIAPGFIVVDLGAGTGNLLAALSKAVGPKGRVVAEDIHSDFLDRARSRANSDGLDNVDFVPGTETDPKLPEAKADLVIVPDARGPAGHRRISQAARGDGDRRRSGFRGAAHPRGGRAGGTAGYRLLWRREHAPGSQYIAMFQTQ